MARPVPRQAVQSFMDKRRLRNPMKAAIPPLAVASGCSRGHLDRDYDGIHGLKVLRVKG